MNVDLSAALTKPASAATQARAAGGASVDYQAFLKLLVTQMKNQDPTAPMESTEYMAQLASFSQVEQSVQMNTKLEQLMQSSALGQADAIIGRTLTSADGAVSGIVKEVTLSKTGLIATLADGRQVAVAAGVRIA